MMDYNALLRAQKQYFDDTKTLPLKFRKTQLLRLKTLLKKNENELKAAIHTDFGKSAFEVFMTEFAGLYAAIDYYAGNLSKLAKPKYVRTNIANWPGSSKIVNDPYGCCLVIGAWNYPYLLSLEPAIAAIAAGNTCIVKPSEIVPNTSKMMADLINDNFDEGFLKVVEGGVEETTALLQQRFDKIFFTGSTKVGKIVYEAAAKNLTPVTLELGGKSPTIVTQHANLKVAAKRIVWGKFLNAGQTCIAPDYILVQQEVKKEFIDLLIEQIQRFDYTKGSKNYTKIVNQNNFERLHKMMDKSKIIFGGGVDASEHFIAPTLLDNVSWSDAVMQEEIFGPLLPIITFNDFDDAINQIKMQEKPLAAYLFSNDKVEQQKFMYFLSFGGGCINDTLMHLSNPRLPFGGVGQSGIGNYHGKYGFDTFTHKKSILIKANWGEPNIKYPPYTAKKENLIKKFI